ERRRRIRSAKPFRPSTGCATSARWRRDMPRRPRKTERRRPSPRRAVTAAQPVQRYTYRVVWSEEDQEFVGLCAEFPSLSWLDRSQGAALAGIVRLVGSVVTEMRRTKETPPV